MSERECVDEIIAEEQNAMQLANAIRRDAMINLSESLQSGLKQNPPLDK